MSLKFVCIAVIGFLISDQSMVQGQSVPERYAQIPSDSIVVSSIDFETIRNLKELEMMPWELIAAVGKQELGIDPLLISTIDFTTGLPTPSGPEFGIVIKTKAPVDIASLNENYFSEMILSPKNKSMKIRDFNNAPVKIIQSESQTVLVGSESTLRRMVVGKPRPSKAIDLISKSNYPIRSITIFESIRPVVEGALSGASNEISPQFMDDLQVVVNELDYISSESQVGFAAEFLIKLGAKDEASLQKLTAALVRLRSNGLEFAEGMLMQQIKSDSDISDEVRAASIQYIQRMKTYLSKADLWKTKGNEMVLDGQLSYSVPTIGVLTGLLLPAVQAAREAARRMQSSNNQKQIMLALFNYESAYVSFPSRALKDAKGTPLLSWRVAILPFIEQQPLYEQFHLDEPWDSEHNLSLLDRMPEIFKHPNFAGPTGHTVYLAPYKTGTVWSLEKPELREITDGTSNTIACFEVNDEHAVPWTKPEDIDLDKVQLLDFFRFPSSAVAMFDGSVQSISPDIDPSILESAVTSSGGEVSQFP